VTYGTGETYAARLGGVPAVIVGAPSGTAVAVRKISDTAFQETEMSDGEVVSVTSTTLLDHSTLEVVRRYADAGRETRRRARRQ
jgi:hypothetical protein